ncbi:hypothetical protein JAAARDRAFT_37998 [Jaapia argillacea MUCL 33604]|uniref:Mitochondrial carrier n=1 Tax=Jaapia argillacea MUCL 33604 TaxID=933084 RepID=A0A067PX28_9AGAM|nr:hypothetical protein JAAARDRAFT_37998 [Jaapia argillacea MUCL 33604]
MSSPSSLRDLYSPPPSSWSFIPPPSPASNSTPSVSDPASLQSSYQWSSRPSPNSIFELSPALNDPTGLDVTLLLKALVASAFLEYASFAIAMPWDVGKMLLQVQWVPRDAGEVEPRTEIVEDVEEEEEELSNSSDEHETYFADPSSSSPARYPKPRLSGSHGYVVRRSVLEESTRPEYIIPVGSADGVWGMMQRIARFNGEGWLSLWKGTLTSCVMDVLSTSVQPIMLSVLQAIFAPTLSPFQHPPLFLPVASHVLTGLLLSPLDLIRTRLIIQSAIPRYQTYSGPYDALSQILRYEGGLKGIYLHPHLLIPTLIDNTLRPLISLALPGIVASYMTPNITEETHPIAWSFAELVGSCAGLVITLPFETIRRRLQAQVRGSAKPVKACVEIRPQPYNGVVDALWHILTEERSDLPLKRRRRRERRGSKSGKDKEKEAGAESDEDSGDEGGSWLKNTGLGQLYRGFGMRLGASAIIFLLGVVSGGEEKDAGWAEL